MSAWRKVWLLYFFYSKREHFELHLFGGVFCNPSGLKDHLFAVHQGAISVSTPWSCGWCLNLVPTPVSAGASLVAQLVKNLPAMQETWVRFLGREDPLEKEMAIHSSILAWRIPMDSGAWQATVYGVTRVGHDLATKPSPPPQCLLVSPDTGLKEGSSFLSFPSPLPLVKTCFKKSSVDFWLQYFLHPCFPLYFCYSYQNSCPADFSTGQLQKSPNELLDFPLSIHSFLHLLDK